MFRKSIFAAIVCSLIAVSVALATSYVVPPDRDMVGRSDLIVVGTAGGSFTQVAAYGGIETVTPFTISEVIKGFGGAAINVHEPGGFLNGRGTIVPGVPRFEAAEQDILFLTKTPQGTWSVTDLALGRFTFERDRTGRLLAVRAENDIVGWDSHLQAYHEVRRDAAEFLMFIRSVARGEQVPANYVVPYEPLQPLKLPPISEALTPQTNTTFTAASYTMATGDSSGVKWFTFPSAVTYKYNFGAGTNTTNALNALNAAFGLWNNDPGSNVNLVNGGNDNNVHSNGAASSDGGNTVNFERSLAYVGAAAFSCPGDGSYSGTLGYGGTTNVSSATQPGPNGEPFHAIAEGDADMNIGVTNCAALVTNGTITGAVAHEVGHSIGFRHADQNRDGSACPGTVDCITSSPNAAPSAVMESFIDAGVSTLQAWDVRAVDAVYPGAIVTTGFVHNDLTGDRRSDIFWRNSVTGANAAYLMSGSSIQTGGLVNFEVDANYKIVGTGDFDADGKWDILWRNSASGANVIYFMNGMSIRSIFLLNFEVDPNYQIVGTGDFNGDGHTDILWRNMSTGANVIYLMTASGGLGSIKLVDFEVDMNYKIIGTGDFNGDGTTDIWWRNSVSGANVVYLMNTTGGIASINLVNFEPDMNWKIQGFGDFNGDGKADVLWRNAVSGANVIYTMNGSSVQSSTLVNFEPDLNWKVVEIGDFNGDGKADILWRNSSTGANVIYTMNGTSITSSALVNFEPDQNWKIIP